MSRKKIQTKKYSLINPKKVSEKIPYARKDVGIGYPRKIQ
jgi:hypothetical protein